MVEGNNSTFKNRCKKLQQIKDEFSRPFVWIIAIIGGFSSLYQSIVNYGNLTYLFLGFAVIFLFALSYFEGAPRFLALRTFAFSIDILFLFVLTIVALPFAYQADGEPSEFIITCVVWSWFIYFVLFDWRFKGTLGKRMLGLRIDSQTIKFHFIRIVIRTILTMLLPVLVGIGIGKILNSSPSKFGMAEAIFVRVVLISANFASIVFLGGNQGFADRITHTAVIYENGTSSSYYKHITKRNWLFAYTIPFIGGLAYALIVYVVGGNFSLNNNFRIPEKPTGTRAVTEYSWKDPNEIIKSECIEPGFRDLSKEVHSIQVETVSNNPFKADGTNLVVNQIDADNLKLVGGLPYLRITTTPWISPASYSRIVSNLAKCYGGVLEDGKHSTAVIQFEKLYDYGFFVIVQHQNTILGVQRRESRLMWGISDLNPRAATGFYVSQDLAGYALLGEWSTRENMLDNY
jgi:hypothetical protein